MDDYPEAARVANVARLFAGGNGMRRDDDLLRRLMLEIEANPDPIFYHEGFVADDGTPEQLEYYHLRLLADDGLLEERGGRGGNFRMTMKGHDFVAAVRSDTIWGRTKAAAAQVQGVSLSLMKDIALGYIRQELAKLGVPLGLDGGA